MKKALKISLIGWLSWHGSAGAMSKSEFLSGLRDMGMLGFQAGTVLERDVGESSFIDAARKGDALLLQQRLASRLNGPFADFMKDLHAIDENGQNVFHAMAAAEKNQERFADIIESLIRISGYQALGEKQKFKIIEIANMILSPEPHLGKTSVIQAVKKAESRAVAFREVEKFIAERPAITVISYLHSKIRRPPGEMNSFGNSIKSVYPRAFLELLLSRNTDPHYFPDEKTLGSLNIYQPHLMRDSQGRRPIDIAGKTGNLPVYSVFYDHDENRPAWLWVGGMAAFGALAGGAAAAAHDSAPMAVISSAAFGSLTGSLMSMCHKSFNKLPVRLNRLTGRAEKAAAARQQAVKNRPPARISNGRSMQSSF